MLSLLNNYQLLEVLKFLRRSELEKCELVSYRVHKIVSKSGHRLALRLFKAMTVTSEFSENFAQIPLLQSEKFHQCEQKCLSRWKREKRMLSESIVGSTILASIANDFDHVRLCISPGPKCPDIGYSEVTAPNRLVDAEMGASILHWISHCQGCEFESIYLRAALNGQLFRLMAVKMTCGELKLVTRIYINEFEQVLQFMEEHVQAETIALDFLDVLELDTRNPVMFGNIVALGKFILHGQQKCKCSFTLSHCKLDLGFFKRIIQAFQEASAEALQMIPSCKFNFNSSAVPWPELDADLQFQLALADLKEESEIGCHHRLYKFHRQEEIAGSNICLNVGIFFIGDIMSAVHLNL